MRFSRYVWYASVTPEYQAQPSSSWFLQQMEMERFELLTLLSLQQPFFQKNDMIFIQGYPFKAISYLI